MTTAWAATAIVALVPDSHKSKLAPKLADSRKSKLTTTSSFTTSVYSASHPPPGPVHVGGVEACLLSQLRCRVHHPLWIVRIVWIVWMVWKVPACVGRNLGGYPAVQAIHAPPKRHAIPYMALASSPVLECRCQTPSIPTNPFNAIIDQAPGVSGAYEVRAHSPPISASHPRWPRHSSLRHIRPTHLRV